MGKSNLVVFGDTRGSTMKQETYEWHRVTGAWHNGLNHVHEHSQGKKDGDACKKSRIRKRVRAPRFTAFRNNEINKSADKFLI